MERRQDETITVVMEVAGVLDAGGVEDGHRVLLDTAVRGGGEGGDRRARGRHSTFGSWERKILYHHEWEMTVSIRQAGRMGCRSHHKPQRYRWQRVKSGY